MVLVILNHLKFLTPNNEPVLKKQTNIQIPKWYISIFQR